MKYVIIILFIFICNIHSTPSNILQYLTDSDITIEGLNLYLDKTMSNSQCGKSLNCISNIVSTYGGWFFEENSLILNFKEHIYMWTNLFFTNEVVVGYNSNGIMVTIRKKNE